MLVFSNNFTVGYRTAEVRKVKTFFYSLLLALDLTISLLLPSIFKKLFMTNVTTTFLFSKIAWHFAVRKSSSTILFRNNRRKFSLYIEKASEDTNSDASLLLYWVKTYNFSLFPLAKK